MARYRVQSFPNVFLKFFAADIDVCERNIVASMKNTAFKQDVRKVIRNVMNFLRLGKFPEIG